MPDFTEYYSNVSHVVDPLCLSSMVEPRALRMVSRMSEPSSKEMIGK